MNQSNYESSNIICNVIVRHAVEGSTITYSCSRLLYNNHNNYNKNISVQQYHQGMFTWILVEISMT